MSKCDCIYQVSILLLLFYIITHIIIYKLAQLIQIHSNNNTKYYKRSDMYIIVQLGNCGAPVAV